MVFGTIAEKACDPSCPMRVRTEPKPAFMDTMFTLYGKTGKLLLRFERSPLEKHAGRRVLVLRVVQVLEPIKHLAENYDGYIKLPEEGELIVRRGKPVRIDVDIHWKNTPMNLMYDLAYPST